MGSSGSDRSITDGKNSTVESQPRSYTVESRTETTTRTQDDSNKFALSLPIQIAQTVSTFDNALDKKFNHLAFEAAPPAAGGDTKDDTSKKSGDLFNYFDKRLNALDPAAKGDTSAKREVSNEPIGINDLNDIPTFFVLDKPTDLGNKLTPPVQIHDPNKTSPLEIRDEKGRVITQDVSNKNYSINKNPETGDIETIMYPDGKVRNLRHAKNDKGEKELDRIETIEKGADGNLSKTVFVKDLATKKWYVEVGSMKAELPGDITFTKDGVISFQMDNAGKWRSERPDGTVVTERTNQAGARIAFNDDNTIQQVVRPDNSKVECIRKNGELIGITELSKDGKSVTWAKQGDKWVSNTNPPQERTKMGVEDNGNLSFETGDNVKHIITGGGIELAQNPNGSEFQFDKEGRFTETKDVNGLRVRGVKYDDATGKVTRAQIGSPESGRVYTYEREGTSDSWRYTVTDGAGNVLMQDRWNGDIKIDKEGTYSYKEAPSHGRNTDGMWRVFKLDGTQQLVQDDGNGGRAIFDANRNLLSVERKNGSGLTVTRVNGQPTEMTMTSPTGEKTKYRFDAASNQFLPEKAGERAFKKIEAEGTGTVKMTDANGSVYLVKLDGSALVKNEDGSTAEVDNQGLVRKSTSKGGDVVRIFNYDNGKLITVSETRKNGEARTLTGKDMSAAMDGSFKYTDANDGQRLSSTADGSWSAWGMFNGREMLVKTVKPNGASRTIVRDASGEPTSIIDARLLSNGTQKSEEFRRVMDNGRWTDSYAKVKEDGKLESRHNVQLLDNGNYNYIDSNGKDKVAKAGGRNWEFGEAIQSASIDEARDSFKEAMEASVKDTARLQRLQVLMAKFEQRMSERMECLIMAGEDKDKTAESIEQKIAKTYDNLTEMVTKEATQDSAFQSKDQRVALAEQFIFHAHDTTKMNQGSNGTCWIHAGHILGMVNHPDAMSRFVKEIALSGSFTTLNNGERDSTPKTVRFSKGLFNFRGEEQRWSPDSPYSNGTRSPIGLIFDQALPVMTGRTWGSNGGNYDGTYGIRRAIYMVTGDIMPDSSHLDGGSERMTFLKHGGMIRYAPGHMATRQLIKRDGQWYVLHDDQHGPGGDWVEYKVGDLRSWSKERAGQVRNDKPWSGVIDGGKVAPVYFPGGRGPFGPGGEDGPGPWRPRRRLRIGGLLRRIFG